MKVYMLCLALLIAAEAAISDDTPRSDVKTMSGMSLLGNQEAPKSLVIVPWKSSELGDPLEVTSALDERARPVDRDVFLRELNYYDIRTGRSEPVSSR
jgi:hypothetical protein